MPLSCYICTFVQLLLLLSSFWGGGEGWERGGEGFQGMTICDSMV